MTTILTSGKGDEGVNEISVWTVEKGVKRPAWRNRWSGEGSAGISPCRGDIQCRYGKARETQSKRRTNTGTLGKRDEDGEQRDVTSYESSEKRWMQRHGEKSDASRVGSRHRDEWTRCIRTDNADCGVEKDGEFKPAGTNTMWHRG